MIEIEGDEDETIREIGGEYDDVGGGVFAQLPIAPDGGIAPGFGLAQPPAPKSATPDNFECLRGPCIHYWQMSTPFDAGNPAGTFEALGLPEPVQIHRTCMRGKQETALNETTVIKCDQWAPKIHSEIEELKARRETYFKQHPEHRDPDPAKDTHDDGTQDDPGAES